MLLKSKLKYVYAKLAYVCCHWKAYKFDTSDVKSFIVSYVCTNV